MARNNFVIHQIEEETIEQQKEQTQKKKYQPEGFVSSIYGKNVVDNTYYQGVKYENKGRQYDSFREKENRVDVDDFKDYIISKDIFSKDNKKIAQIEEEQPIYQGNYSIQDEVEEEVYSQEEIEKEEYVSVKTKETKDKKISDPNDYFNITCS